MTAASEFVRQLQVELETTLDRIVPRGARCALLNVADYPNVGDAAITLGQLAYLERRKVELVEVSTIRTYDPDRLRRELRDGIILFQGGGHFGDLYPAHHGFRERVIQAFPDNPIATFPTTFKFRDQRVLERTKRLYEQHGNIQLLVRDHVSFDAMQQAFDLPVHLTPDVAFAMGPLDRARLPDRRVQLLCRTDEEAEHELPAAYRSEAVDWLHDPRAVQVRQVASRLAWLLGQPTGFVGRRADKLNLAACRTRFQHGMDLLARGEVVVSDRLHATIMSTLQGVPVLMVGDKHGKLRTFYDTWLRDAPTVTWNDDFPAALERATSSSKS